MIKHGGGSEGAKAAQTLQVFRLPALSADLRKGLFLRAGTTRE
jgi:hypothetical protein